MRVSLRDLPIKRKLMLIIVLATGVALLLMGGALVVYERSAFRAALRTNLAVLAQIVGSNSTGALAFDDPETAREILGALLAEKQIKAAAIYDNSGRIFARFPADAPVDEFPIGPGKDGHQFSRRELVMFEPIVQQGTRLGTIYLAADLGAMYARFRIYGLLLAVVGICSTLAALVASARLQRHISNPILQLADVAGSVSERHDYSVRAPKLGQDEIGRLTDAFNDMLARIGQSSAALAASEERLRRANKEKDNFIAILSHELRTPLTPALTAVEMLQDDETLAADVRDALGMIRRNIEVEARLIDDLLDINRIAHGKLELRREIVDVRRLIEHALQNYCLAAATRKNIRVTTEITASETHVFADSSRLTQVFWNLLQNACKFTPEDGAIHVRVVNEPSALSAGNGESAQEDAARPDVIVQVRDTGMGISAKTLPRIFHPFEQGRRSRDRAFGGLGLGLALSRAIVEMHGGSISATSEGKNKGATFVIRLHTVAALDAAADEQTPVVSAVHAPSRPMSVLVVEDHMDTAEQFARLLQRSGHEVICARTIGEARKYATTPARTRGRPFDILISDLDLPDGSGRDLMRSLSKRYPIRGIAISGHGMKEDVESSIAAGFEYHITKPVNWQELKAALQNISSAVVREETNAPA